MLTDVFLVVGEGLGHHDQEERGRRAEARDLDVAHLGAEPAERLERPFERPLDLGIDPLEEVRARHADPEATDVLTERRQIVVDRRQTRGRIGGIVTRHGLQEVRAILHRARHRASVVERPREREDPRAAHAPVRRLEPHDATEGGRPADGPAGVRARGADDEPGRQGGARAAARAARDVVEVPRIARRREAMAGALDAEGELVGHELAEEHRARLLPAAHARGVLVGDEVGQEGGGRRCPDAPREIDVLVGDRNAEQRARVTAPQRLLGRARLGQGAVGRQGDEGAQGGVELLDPRQQRTRHLDG